MASNCQGGRLAVSGTTDLGELPSLSLDDERPIDAGKGILLLTNICFNDLISEVSDASVSFSRLIADI